MAAQICPLLPSIGLQACGAANDFYLVGVAGWIFGGIGLLMLMGISDDIENRKAARRAQITKDSFALKLTSDAPIQLQATSHSAEAPLVAKSRPLHGRVRSLRRPNLIHDRADAEKRVQSGHQ